MPSYLVCVCVCGYVPILMFEYCDKKKHFVVVWKDLVSGTNNGY